MAYRHPLKYAIDVDDENLIDDKIVVDQRATHEE